MTHAEIEQHVDAVFEMFGTVPDPEHEPVKFKYFMRLYWYYSLMKKSQKKVDSTS